MLKTIILIIFGILILYLLLRLRTLHRAIHTMTLELKEINQEEPVHRHLQIPIPDAELELLAEEINRYLTQSFSRSYAQKRHEQDVKQEITNISHDLRTPLTSILGYLELMQEEVLTREQSEYLDIVRKRSKHLDTLITQLYEYTRLTNHELKLHMEALDLRLLLQEHLLSFYQEFEAKGICLSPALGEHPVMVRADKNALNRILHNLTSNILKYGSSKAEITLTEAANEIILTCSNQAPSLTKEETEHLFDPFFTADNARTSQKSGLGMTVARLLTEQMGGSMTAELKEGILTIICSYPKMLPDSTQDLG